MKKYLDFIGAIELVSAIIGIIVYSIYFFKAIKQVHGNDAWLLLAGYLAFVVFSPAVGILFLTVSSLIERAERLESNLSKFKVEVARKEIDNKNLSI